MQVAFPKPMFRSSCLALTLLLFTGCAVSSADVDGQDDLGEDVELISEGGKFDDAHSSYLTSTVVQYEGSCEFLRNCSVWSDEAPVGEVSWGCSNVGSSCQETDHFMAVPRQYKFTCGETVTVCLGDTCTTAQVRDVSCCGRFEASSAVLDDLGVPHGENVDACSGFGEANLRIYRGIVDPSEVGEDTIFCAKPGGTCGGNSPCWADCPQGSNCDYANGDWGVCR